MLISKATFIAYTDLPLLLLVLLISKLTLSGARLYTCSLSFAYFKVKNITALVEVEVPLSFAYFKAVKDSAKSGTYTALSFAYFKVGLLPELQ